LKKKPKLLVVEDDFENQKLLEIYLSKKFDIMVCDSADSFYECLKNSKFDMFLVDISLLGDKNGLELMKELRQSSEYVNSPIVCISAHVFPADRENAFKAGADEFLARPIYNEELLASLLKVYNKKNRTSLT
jgi:DNA-binding response OmpR family regulator